MNKQVILFAVILGLVLPAFSQTKVAVVGGGMAGVSAAHYITQFDQEVQLILYEKETILGGNAKTVQIENKKGEKVDVDAGPQYFAEKAWEDYIAFLEETLGENAFVTESMGGTILIQRENQEKPVLVSPLGMKLRGEKLGKLLKFKRFNNEAHKVFKNPDKWEGVSIGEWVESLKFPASFKTEIIYPFLGATLGTSIEEIKTTSAVDIVKLFAFRKPKASSQFMVVQEGMGSLIQRVGETFPKDRVEIKTNAAVTKVKGVGAQWEVTYLVSGKEQTDLVDYVVLGTHAYQAQKILSHDEQFHEITAVLARLNYFDAVIAIHSDEQFVNTEKPAFLNINIDENNELTSSTMNLSMISERLDGIYKSWVDGEAISKLREDGKLMYLTHFYHPLITTEFISDLALLHGYLSNYSSLSIIGGWSEGLETQNSAVVSGKKVLKKYKEFKELKE